eukprot:3259821-Pyramimonas_sp.AAC.1
MPIDADQSEVLRPAIRRNAPASARSGAPQGPETPAFPALAPASTADLESSCPRADERRREGGRPHRHWR